MEKSNKQNTTNIFCQGVKFFKTYSLKSSLFGFLFLFLACSADDDKLKSSQADISKLELTIDGKNHDIKFDKKWISSIKLDSETNIPKKVTINKLKVSEKATCSHKEKDEIEIKNNTISITVTAEDGQTKKIYTVNINISPKKTESVKDYKQIIEKKSKEANITSLELEILGTEHTITFDDQVKKSIEFDAGSVIPAKANIKALTVSDGATTNVSAGDDVSIVSDKISITVTAEDGTTKKTYEVAVSVATHTSANIKSLKLEVLGTEHPITFDAQGKASIELAAGSVMPDKANIKAFTVSDGATTNITGNDVSIVSDKISIVVTAEDGTTKKTYEIAVSVATHTSANIISLKLEVLGTEHPITFDAQGKASIELAAGNVIPATAKVNEIKVSDGATSNVSAGNDVSIVSDKISIVVTAEDGTTKKTYEIAVSVATHTSANIISLKLEVLGTEHPITFDAQGKASIELAAGNVIPATAKVNEIKVSDGATSNVSAGNDVSIVSDKISIVVTAEDGTTKKTYEIAVSVATHTSANIKSLKLEVLGTEHPITFDAQGKASIELAAGSVMPDKANIKAFTVSDGATSNVSAGNDVSIVSDKISIVVTAEDGTTKKTYEIAVSVATHTSANIISLKLEVLGTEHPITFDAQGKASIELAAGSVMPDKANIKAFTVSDGATSNVSAGNDVSIVSDKISIVVTAEDGTTKKTYEVAVSVATYTLANITSLKLEVDNDDIDLSFSNKQAEINHPYGQMPTSIKVTDFALSPKASATYGNTPLSKNQSLNFDSSREIKIIVTAEDGVTENTYTIKTKEEAASSEKEIKKLVLTEGGSHDYEIEFTGTIGTNIQNKFLFGTTEATVKELTLSDHATASFKNGDHISFINNTATITVTAQDGTTQDYTINIQTTDDPNWTTKDVTIDGVAGISILEYNGSGKDLVIPATINGKKVLAIGDDSLPDSITPSFKSRNALESIDFSNATNLKIINKNAFNNKNIAANSRLKSVILGNSVETIGERAFSSNGLTSLTIPDNVKTIFDQAFRSNVLTSLTLGSRVTAIGEDAFYGNKLTSLTIPDNVKTIGDYAFSSNGLTSLTLGSGVTAIGKDAFSQNELTSVTIPNSVTTIGDWAFAKNQLTSVTIRRNDKNSLMKIENDTFDSTPLKDNNPNTKVTITVPSGLINEYKTLWDGKIDDGGIIWEEWQ